MLVRSARGNGVTITISSISPATTASVANATVTATQRAADAALAKATAKLAADKKAQASEDALRADQKVITDDTKAAQKADTAANSNSGTVNVTA